MLFLVLLGLYLAASDRLCLAVFQKVGLFQTGSFIEHFALTACRVAFTKKLAQSFREALLTSTEVGGSTFWNIFSSSAISKALTGFLFFQGQKSKEKFLLTLLKRMVLS